jgi:hypothetical protein
MFRAVYLSPKLIESSAEFHSFSTGGAVVTLHTLTLEVQGAAQFTMELSSRMPEHIVA